MKVLLVCRYKEDMPENVAPFVLEQRNALQRCGVECDWFLVRAKGIRGYLKQLRPLKKKISVFRPEVIHAHYGLCGLLANLQGKVPVVTTYHGSDINDPKAFRFSKMAIRLSAWNIFVSRKNMAMARVHDRCSLIPCGIDLDDSQLVGKKEARRAMCLGESKRYVLFAGAFNNPVKNAPLAKETVTMLHDETMELLELKGYSREEVTLLMCAVDALLLTSLNEGSPQVIKEALACGCPIVSVDVGDVRERISGVEGCRVATTRDPRELKELLVQTMAFEGKTNGRKHVVTCGLDNRQVAEQIIVIYNKIIML